MIPILMLLGLSSASAFNNTIRIDRTLDLSDIGIDVSQTFDKLLSPSGIVNQYSLTLYLSTVYLTGYILVGKKTTKIILDFLFYSQDWFMPS